MCVCVYTYIVYMYTYIQVYVYMHKYTHILFCFSGETEVSLIHTHSTTPPKSLLIVQGSLKCNDLCVAIPDFLCPHL